MRYALLFGLLSISLLGVSALAPEERWPIIWIAASFGITALGYAGLGIQVFGKRPSGTLPLPLKIINLPYLLYTWAIWHLWRCLSKEPAFNKVDEDMVIGRRLLSHEATEDFDHYVDLTAEFDEPKSIRTRRGYLNFPILDASIPDARKLKQAIQSVSQGRTYIHCAQGHGRTGLFALALLLHRGKANTIEGGIGVLQTARPDLKLNREQLAFAKTHLDSMGTKDQEEEP